MNVEADTFKKYDVRKWLASPMLGAAILSQLVDDLLRLFI
jgi:hypothetical protein